MKTNKEGIDLLHHFESCKLDAYICPASVWTIGWGNTQYEDGSKVRPGDRVTQERADELFLNILSGFEKSVQGLVKSKINDNQFSALVPFSYNVGAGNLQKSTLLKKLNIDPSDPSIKDEFLKWNKAGGKALNGLTRRREAESKLYFS